MNKTIRRMAIVAMACVALPSEAQKFNTYTEAKDPVPVSRRSQEAWQTIGRLQAQWVSADSLYSRSEVPMPSNTPVAQVEGWRGERVAAQLLLFTGKETTDIKCVVKDFCIRNRQDECRHSQGPVC